MDKEKFETLLTHFGTKDNCINCKFLLEAIKKGIWGSNIKEAIETHLENHIRVILR